MAITVPFNNYAKVTTIGADGKTINYTDKTADGIAKISTNSLVMFHVSKHKDSADMNLLGKFILAKVLSDDGNSLTLDTAVTKVFEPTKLNKYDCQIISVAQFNNLTIDYDYNATTAWNDNKKIGGICAIAVKGLLNLENGKINVEGKGGGNAYGREGLAFIGNAQMADILPLGQGHGSIFIVAKECKINENSRVGATYKGNKLGGFGGYDNYTPVLGGYKGKYYGDNGGAGYNGGGKGGNGSNQNSGGSGEAGGYLYSKDGSNEGQGGYGSDGKIYSGYSYELGKQGAHIWAVIDTLNKYIQAVFSTGGHRGYGSYGQSIADDGGNGGSGYGGTGCNDGSGGGSTGWCYINIKSINEINNEGIVAS